MKDEQPITAAEVKEAFYQWVNSTGVCVSACRPGWIEWPAGVPTMSEFIAQELNLARELTAMVEVESNAPILASKTD